MVDLETLNTEPNSAVISIGAVRFDPVLKAVDDKTFYAVLDLDEQTKAGRTASIQTIIWWMKQSDEARAVFLADPSDPLLALQEFNKYISGAECFWSQGTMDWNVLQHLYGQCKMEWPYEYYMHRDFRTILRVAEQLGFIQEDRDDGHNALADAQYQASTLCEILGSLAII